MGIFDNLIRGKTKESSSGISSESHSYKVGDLIANRYEIQNIFGGEGKTGMGIVFVCHDHQFKEILALKTFQERFFHSKNIKDSFKKEALAWIQIEKHLHIVRAYWVKELDNRMFVACEFITPDGEGRNTLTDYFKTTLSLRQALTWSIQFCHGMEYAFSKGITPHRDIKPDNILITIDGTLKITDFGLAGLWDKAGIAEELKDLMKKNRADVTFLKIANNRIVAGTPSWMAPEQFYGVANVWSDIYSFGIVMYQMLNKGELPFKPQKGESWETAHKTYPVPPLHGQGKVMSHIVGKCIGKRREKRYKDFKELREDIEEVFKKEITKKTGEKPPPPPESAGMKESELINKGISLASLGLIDEAIKQYKEGLRINPENAPAHNNLGNAFAQKGLFAGAIREYREAVKIDPDYTMAYYNLGMTLFKRGLLDEAIREYRNALKIDKEFTEAYVGLGMALFKKGMFDETIKAYKEALRINPWYAEAYHNLGIALFSKGLIDEAVDAYNEALRIKPEYAEVYQNLGTALFQKGLFNEAVREYRKAIAIKPEYAEAYYNMGISLLKSGQLSEAINAYEDFIKFAPQQDKRIEKAREIIKNIGEKLRAILLNHKNI